MNKYFITDGKEKFGPFSKEELRNQNISMETKVWCYGMEQWEEISQIPDLEYLTSVIPPGINLKSTEEPLRKVEFEPKSTSKKELKSIQATVKKNKISSTKKWLIAVGVIALISIIGYSSVQKQSDINLYNEIVANSYESDENFEMYVEKFYRDLEISGITKKNPKSTIIKLSRLDQIDNATHIHGVSYGFNDDDKIEIYINASTWKKFNKPMRYFLMYHELAHDILNVSDLDNISQNEGKLMYPEISTYENKSMDDFIESFHSLFDEFYIR